MTEVFGLSQKECIIRLISDKNKNMMMQRFLHKMFLLLAFAACSFAVILFAWQQASATPIGTDYTDITTNTTLEPILPTNSIAVNGKCSSVDGATLISAPLILCVYGDSSNFTTTDTGWKWQCLGKNGGSDETCSAKKYTPITTNTISTSSLNTTATNIAKDGVCSYVNGTKVTAAPTILCNSGNASGFKSVSTGWTWNCLGIDGGKDAYCGATIVETTPPSTTTAVPISTSTTNTNSTTISSFASEKSTTSSTSENQAANVNLSGTTSLSQQSEHVDDESETEKDRETQIMPRENVVINNPKIVFAKDLPEEKNPKISGEVNETMKVDTVEMKKKDDGKKNITLSGKAQPNMLLTIYIFSNDPVVITVRTDENGNWNYELDKEIADGRHEAYVAVTDDSGKIITKSQPVAFVKTAEAATVIPISDLQEKNQSPIVRYQQKYIFIALVIMSVCLAIALALMGILNHKRHLDERID